MIVSVAVGIAIPAPRPKTEMPSAEIQNAVGEFALEDPGEAAAALLGAIGQAAMGQILATGQLDAEAPGDRLVPLLLSGVLAR